MNKSPVFDLACTDCPRLSEFLAGLRDTHPEYHNRPVPPFGDPEAQLLIVGLAPGMHGANASGRPFTGDFAGIVLYETLHRFGYSDRPASEHKDDGLALKGCRITNAVKCLPPQNKPVGSEINTCNRFLAAELATLADDAVVLALGTIAHNAVLRAQGETLSRWKFGHGQVHQLPGGLTLLDSYHCSRYNINTRRLTQAMFDQIFKQAADLLARTGEARHA